MPDEPCWSGLVRLQCAAGELTAAPRRSRRCARRASHERSISPLISAACARGERPAAAEARDAAQLPDLLTAAEFIPLLAMQAADTDASSFRDTLMDVR